MNEVENAIKTINVLEENLHISFYVNFENDGKLCKMHCFSLRSFQLFDLINKIPQTIKDLVEIFKTEYNEFTITLFTTNIDKSFYYSHPFFKVDTTHNISEQFNQIIIDLSYTIKDLMR